MLSPPAALLLLLAAPRRAAGDYTATDRATGKPLTVRTHRDRFEFKQVGEWRHDHHFYPGGVIKSQYRSPPIHLKTGEAWFSLPDVTIMPFAHPGVPYAIIAGEFDIVDEGGRSVPLSEVYSHHWLVYDKLIGGSGYNIGCGGEDTFISIVFGAGGEMRGIDYRYPDGHGYITRTATGKTHWSGNLHFIRTEDLSTAHFNGSVGEATKSCIECGYVLGKAPECLPDLQGEGIFACCFDGCRCPVNNRKDKTKRTYYLQYNVTWTTDLSRTKAIKMMVVDALDCGIVTNLAPAATKHLPAGTSCDEKVCVSSQKRDMPFAGTILWGYTHQHLGAIDSSLAINGKHVCDSHMIWGTDPANPPGNEKGYGVGAKLCINSPARPEEAVHVAKGATLHITSRYSVDPADQTNLPVPGGSHRGIMDLFFFYIDPDDVPPPPPVPPAPDAFKCNGAGSQGVPECVVAAGGTPRETCLATCFEPLPPGPGPAPTPPEPADTYKCVGGECVAAPGGVPVATCHAAC